MRKKHIVIIILIAFAIIAIIFPEPCDFVGGWASGRSRACECKGKLIVIANSLDVDGDYQTACIGLNLPKKIKINQSF